MLLTFIKLLFVIKSFVLSIFEWPFYVLLYHCHVNVCNCCFHFQGSSSMSFPRIHIDFSLSGDDSLSPESQVIDWQYNSAEEEIW